MDTTEQINQLKLAVTGLLEALETLTQTEPRQGGHKTLKASNIGGLMKPSIERAREALDSLG